MSDYPDDDMGRFPGAGTFRFDASAFAKVPPPGTLLQGLVDVAGPLECVLDGIRQCQRQGATDAKVKLGATGAASATIWREVSEEPTSTEPMVMVPRKAVETVVAVFREHFGIADDQRVDETDEAYQALRTALGD